MAKKIRDKGKPAGVSHYSLTLVLVKFADLVGITEKEHLILPFVEALLLFKGLSFARKPRIILAGSLILRIFFCNSKESLIPATALL